MSLLKVYTALAFAIWLLWFFTARGGMVDRAYKKYRPAGTIGYWAYTVIVCAMMYALVSTAFGIAFYLADPFPLKHTPLYRLFFN